MRRFEKIFLITPRTRVLDVGGTPECWSMLGVRPQVIFLNTPRAAGDLAGAHDWVAGDGCRLPFRAQSFDIVFSNSVIEHVGDAARQKRFAEEVARVGRSYWVQTPNRWFLIESHLWTPFIHWLPQALRRAVIRASLWSIVNLRRRAEERDFYLRHFMEEIRLLSSSDVAGLFPEAAVIRERVAGMAKSLIAVKVCDNEDASQTMDQALLEKMQRDWDARARENARYYVATARTDWSDDDFFESGRHTVAEEIGTDMINVCQGKEPSQMRVLEIGCGAGRVTRALSETFGEVHGIDVSGEMIARARESLKDRPNVHLYQNNGTDLSVVPDGLVFDFAFSAIVFQHIPSREVIENYVREVHGLLRPGALFKFQVQGDTSVLPTPGDTWLGVSFSEQQAVEMAYRCGFEPRYRHGAGEQYFWLWYFKK